MPKFCLNCGTETVPLAKFCSECGTKLSAEPIDVSAHPVIVAESEIPSKGFTIRFPISGAANYQFAVDVAKKSSSYAEFRSGKQIIHQATFQAREVEELLSLLEALKGLRNRKVWVDGEPTLWDDAFAWLWCFNRRRSSYSPELYCFGEEQRQLNLWGCVNSGMSFGRYARWLTYGQFEGDGAFVLDKERIHHEVRTTLYRFRFCPAIDLSLADEVVDALPDKVNPKKDKNWRYQKSFGSPLGASESTMTIEVREGDFKYQATASGVEPANLKPAQEIFSRIKRKLPDSSKFSVDH